MEQNIEEQTQSPEEKKRDKIRLYRSKSNSKPKGVYKVTG